MLAELNEYIDSNPVDAPSVRLAVQFLQSLNMLFEEGFLTHEKIHGINSSVLARMQQGYSFFVKWLDPLIDEGVLSLLHTT